MSKQKKFLSDGHVRVCTFKFDLKKRWYLQYFVKGINEPFRIWIPTSFNTVESRLNEVERVKKHLLNGTPYEVKKPITDLTYSQSVSKRLSNVLSEKSYLKKKSKQGYACYLRNFDKWLNEKQYNSITESTALEFLNDLVVKGRKANTVNNYRRVLKHFVKSVRGTSNLKTTAFDKTKKIRGGGGAGREYFKPTQKALIKDYLEKNYPALWLACKFVYYCYVRNGNELVNLKISDLDLNLRRLKISSDNSKNGLCEVVVIPKVFANELLKIDFSKYPQNYFLLGKNGLPSSKIVSNGYWGKQHKKALDSMGFDKGGKVYSMYSWKNTGVVDSYLAGIGIKDLQAQLRHKNLETTYMYLKAMGLFDNADTFDKIDPL